MTGPACLVCAGKLRLLEEDIRERDAEFDREEEREQNDIKVQLRSESSGGSLRSMSRAAEGGDVWLPACLLQTTLGRD